MTVSNLNNCEEEEKSDSEEENGRLESFLDYIEQHLEKIWVSCIIISIGFPKFSVDFVQIYFLMKDQRSCRNFQ